MAATTLLTATLVFLWAHSYPQGWQLQAIRPLGRVFTSSNGAVEITHWRGWPNPPPPAWHLGLRYAFDRYAVPAPGGEGGPRYYEVGEGGGSRGLLNAGSGHLLLRPTEVPPDASRDRDVRVERSTSWLPYWPATLAAAALPLWALCGAAAAWRARRRAAKNIHACLTCGYDLRATPGRCPECGTPAGGASE